ncbi:hypothetical protein DSM117340_03012 [Lentibacter algarum]
MADGLKQGILLVAPLEGPVTGQAEISLTVARTLARTDKVFLINTNFESLGTVGKVCAQIKALAQIICKYGRYDRVYLSFKRGNVSVLLDYIFLLVIQVMHPHLVVGHLHGNEIFCSEKPAFLRRIFARNLKMCDQLICLNSYQKDQLASVFQIENCSVVPNFSNLGLSQSKLETRLSELQPRDGLNVMYFSNLMVEKGIMDFLDVAAMTGDGIQYSVFGKPLKEGTPDAITIRERLDVLPANTRYFGPVYGDDRLPAWKPIDVILFPSTYATEAQPLVIIEAMSMGIIPIVYDRPYASDLIPPQSDAGVRVQYRALNDVVVLLHRLRDDPKLVTRMRRAAWTSAQNFSRDKFEETIATLMKPCE